MASFPIPAPAFNGRSRRVPASSALAWLKQGWAIFGVSPGTWMAMMGGLLAIVAALGVVPMIGHLLLLGLAPLFAGGVLFACRKAAREQAVGFADLFAGMQRNAPGLLLLGALYVSGMLLVVLVIALLTDSARPASRGGPASAPGGVLLTGLSWLLLLLPTLIATWSAPALVTFNRMPPLKALRASVNASLKNLPAFLVLALISILPCAVAALPFGLGFVVLAPVLAGSMYASYHDIFLGD